MIIEIHPENDNKENNTNVNAPKSQNRDQQSHENTKPEKSSQNNLSNDKPQRKENLKDKLSVENKDDKVNQSAGSVNEKKRKCSPSPTRSPTRSSTPIPESRTIIISPAEKVMPPPPHVYAPTLVPPVEPLFYEEAPSTVCLDELKIFIAEPLFETNDNIPDVADETEENCATSVCSQQSKQLDVLSLLAPEEYSPELNTPSVNALSTDSSYIPTPKNVLQLKAMADCQKSRIILNVGGSRFETCVPTLQQDPSAILSYMILKDSPLKPYKVDNIYTYFLDRDPRHFVHILNYLRSECSMDLSTFPRTVIALRELQRECTFYNLTHLHCLLEKRIVDILQGHLLE